MPFFQILWLIGIIILLCKISWKYSWHRTVHKKKDGKKYKENKPLFHFGCMICLSQWDWIGSPLINKKQFTLHLLNKNQTVISHLTLLSIPMTVWYAFLYQFCSVDICIIQRWTRQFSCIDVFLEMSFDEDSYENRIKLKLLKRMVNS